MVMKTIKLYVHKCLRCNEEWESKNKPEPYNVNWTKKQKKEYNEIVSMPEIKEKVKIDEIDKDIILELGKDSNIPSWKISDKLANSTSCVNTFTNLFFNVPIFSLHHS
jgi:hypothetical protein